MIAIREIVWDSWNIAHIARHEVVPNEVEEVCHSGFITFESYKERTIVLGPTQGGRMLAIVLDPLGAGAYYPITARPASRAERRRYAESKEGEAP